MDPRAPLTDQQKRRAVLGALAPMTLAVLEQTIVAPILPIVGRELGGAFVAWLVTAYLLAATASTPLWGKIADARGRRPALLAALGVFALGSLISALAPDMAALLAGRTVQGLGGGGLIAVAQTLIADAVAPKERGKYVGYISAMWLSASVAGPMLGGLAAGAGLWRAIFWINLPLALAAFALSRTALAAAPTDLKSRPIDVLGAALSAAAIAAFLLAVTWIGEEEAARALAAALAALILGIAFWRRSASAAEPLIPAAMLRLAIVRIGAATSFLAFAGHIGLATSAPFFLVERGLYPAMAGFALMALLVGAVAGANTAGRLMARSPRYRRYGLMGLAAACLASFWLGLRCGTASLFEIEAALFLAGLGAGAQNPVTAIAAQNAVDQRDLGVVTAFFAVARSLGGAFGAACLAAVVSLLSPDSPERVLAADATRHAPAFFAAAACYALAALVLTRMENRPLRER